MKTATQKVRELIHPDCVPLSEYDALRNSMSDLAAQIEGARSEAAGLRHELGNEVANAEALTALAARAIVSYEILKNALIERQIGKQNQGDPSRVLVVNLPKKEETKPRYMPLHKRRRQVERKRRDEDLRRTALPKLLAELPPMPLTEADVEAMQEAVNELKALLSASNREA